MFFYVTNEGGMYRWVGTKQAQQNLYISTDNKEKEYGKKIERVVR